jgi:hypothetical protein
MPDTTTTSFPSMDVSTREQWDHIARESIDDWANVPDRMLGMLRGLSGITNGFAVDQLTHVCQTAARRTGGCGPEVVAAALLTSRKPSRGESPAAGAAQAVRRPEVAWMVEVHQSSRAAYAWARIRRPAVRRPPRYSSPSGLRTSGTRPRSISTTPHRSSTSAARADLQLPAPPDRVAGSCRTPLPSAACDAPRAQAQPIRPPIVVAARRRARRLPSPALTDGSGRRVDGRMGAADVPQAERRALTARAGGCRRGRGHARPAPRRARFNGIRIRRCRGFV